MGRDYLTGAYASKTTLGFFAFMGKTIPPLDIIFPPRSRGGSRVNVSSVAIYHITHIDNLPSIITDGFLRSDFEQRKRGAKHQTIGYTHIKERRLKHPVKVA